MLGAEDRAAIDWLMDGLSGLDAPDQGMTYRNAHHGKRRYDEETGEPYISGSRPAVLTVYGERANWLYALIRRADEIRCAIASGIEARSDETQSGSAEGESPVSNAETPNG